CMPAYRDNLVSFIESCGENICEDCQRRKATNPIRVLDCKNEKCQHLYTNAPKLINQLCDGCQSDFNTLKTILDDHNIAYEIDTNLVRGLDYYSKTAFEFVSDNIGSQSAIAGGGRYDRLIEFLDGKPTPAVGFAIGIERLMELIVMPESIRDGYYFGAMENESLALILKCAEKYRQTDKAVVEYEPKNLKNHLKGADRINARYCAVIGENERNTNSIWIKDLLEQKETIISLDAL
ncbi:MAG: ATP phosphoribosyltransferase regulatory subunit, partial [Sulfuricurvum sp.]|nr:ATP phosphoribosyltransferase regulatory subunit [Sulfuricurvum sp.]